MSRFIDCQPVHPNPREKEVILLSFGRNATNGFYHALKILGYKPYHQVEVFKNGVSHIRMMDDAVRAGSLGEGKKFTREDFDKWFGDYDSVTDVPAWFLPELVAAYPNAKFVLTERDPEAWRRSVAKTFQPMATFFTTPSVRLIGMFDAYTYYLTQLGHSFRRILYRGYMGGDKERELDECVELYNAHNKAVKELIPPEKLLVVRLEDGLGWDKLCPFIGKDIPDVPYPRVNDTAEFQRLATMDLFASWKKTGLKMASLTVPLIGASIWFARQR
ncbi:unnamed protein product [Colletotrichum noveboracense]|uniref:NAD dependent epimerase/dehydratase n=1 Tax=Colletotrichum noveboracense TaxID=2664923 RepID=A0A9W4RKN8_9PEZI|nr:hypothetical protein K456DRAFT_58469 [Colletotrichum gloeosporioides 23]KAJ0275050.1 hypothetical protein COL940_008988 [Colletotrichum noveboracense]CAI0642896.1 unnamed protein product [Colletotrichum noveboracense]